MSGHFLQPDSILPSPYNPVTLDRYAYTGNNAVNYNDPSGHCFDPLTFIACVLIAGSLIEAITAAAPEIEAEVPVVTEAAAGLVDEAGPVVEKLQTEASQEIAEAGSEIQQTFEEITPNSGPASAPPCDFRHTSTNERSSKNSRTYNCFNS